MGVVKRDIRALIVNEDAFTTQNLTKVGYASNPLTDGSLKAWNVIAVPISTLNARSLEDIRAVIAAKRGTR